MIIYDNQLRKNKRIAEPPLEHNLRLLNLMKLVSQLFMRITNLVVFIVILKLL